MKETSDPSMKGTSQSMMDTGNTSTLFHQSQRLSRLIGAEVQNGKGESIGKINDLVTAEDGRINYLVIARGGMMGLGEKLVPVPVAEVSARLASDGKCIIDMDKTVFENAPSFAGNEWPDLTSGNWKEEARGYFGGQEKHPSSLMPGK
jgi:sporulation protein YlmC with PRC-barrel domain